MKPTIGRIVHYQLGTGRSKGEYRPALIVRVWNDSCVNLQVFLDGSNDRENELSVGVDSPLTAWKTSSVQGDGPGQWKWPDRA